MMRQWSMAASINAIGMLRRSISIINAKHGTPIPRIANQRWLQMTKKKKKKGYK